MTRMSKFCFFGTPGVAAETLSALLAAGFTPALVVTNPDAPRGRGLVLTPSPVKALALERGIPVSTPDALDEAAQKEIATYGCDYAVVVAYGKIFPEGLINAFPKGVLNVHYSLLPKYRGATPMEAALLNGDTETGVTIQKMVRALDAGDILALEATPIAPNETARELRPRLLRLGAELLVETLPKFERGEIVPRVQDSARATRARKFKKEDGCLDLADDARENWNKYRAYADTIGTHFFTASGPRVKIKSAECAEGTFRVLSVVPEGKSEISLQEFEAHGKKGAP